MTLAQEIGFNVPNCHLETVGKGLFYCIDRYDRKTDKQQHVNRIHQEDFCQALGLPSAKKYEKDKGLTLQQIAKLIKGHRIGVPIKTLQNLIGWQIFNVLTGNCDGHAKNLSIIREGDQWELAPFYDLVSTEAYKNIFS